MVARVQIFFSALLLYCFSSIAQTDTLQLEEVTVNAYLERKPLLRLPTSTAVIDSVHLSQQHGQSLVPVLNTVPGVRMEERSPGSYRLSIRGSLLRSPFGVRNVKVYVEDFALTNAGGETYLNLLDQQCIRSLEILKGPDGSLFGSNSGGVVRLNAFPSQVKSKRTVVGFGVGSFGMLQLRVSAEQQIRKQSLFVDVAQQMADGYRDHSRMHRSFVQLGDRISYSESGQLKLYMLVSDLRYQTPGGLTFAQYDTNRRQPRPATMVTPGAKEQNAGIRNLTIFAGAEHALQISKTIRHHISLFSSYTDFHNPFITNYEIRNERNGGTRTWLSWKTENETSIFSLDGGAELQQMLSEISNFRNLQGTRDTLQAADRLNSGTGFVFLHGTADLSRKFVIDGGLSFNFFTLQYQRRKPEVLSLQKRNFTPQVMPRLAVSYYLLRGLAVRMIVSKGYSPPTLQEVRSSDNTFNPDLKPEQGTNYELGLRYKDTRRISWDLAVFRYQLNEAIVRRTNNFGQEFFINSGGTIQQGLESSVELTLLNSDKGALRRVALHDAVTLSDFRFDNPQAGAATYHGKRLPGVPRRVIVNGLTMEFPFSVYLFAQHYYCDNIMLDDANTSVAWAYHLVQAKAGIKFRVSSYTFDVQIGADNILDENYSLGNDLNAFGGRYYNAAPGRNYFVRLNVWY